MMYYKDKRVAITGSTGFIGRELTAALENEGADVVALAGDVRDPATFEILNHTYDYLFHFAAPSSQVLFARNKDHCAEVTLVGFMNAAKACKTNGIKLIYPSTGLLSQGKTNEYAICKAICEQYASVMGIDALGIRIFATYGPGEAHKRDYASVPYLFARDMVTGHAPTIFGDGRQTRDFIYIDDVAAAILVLAENCNMPVIDLGSGVATSFQDMHHQLQVITAGPDAVYVERPGNYVQETLANTKPLSQFYEPQISFAEGLQRTVDYMTAKLKETSE